MNNLPSLFFSFYIDDKLAYMIEDRTPQKILLKDFLRKHVSINLQTSSEKKAERLRNLVESGKYVLVRQYGESEIIDYFNYEKLSEERIEAYFQHIDACFDKFKDYSVFEDIVLDSEFSITDEELKAYLIFQMHQFTQLPLCNYEFKKYPNIKLSPNFLQKRVRFFKYLKQFYQSFFEQISLLEKKEEKLFKIGPVESTAIVNLLKQEITLFREILEETK